MLWKLTPNTDSEGVLAQENILNATGAILTSEGARVPTSKLIVNVPNCLSVNLNVVDLLRVITT